MRKILVLILSIIASVTNAQITDDSSKLVYGPKTIEVIYENQLKNNQEKEIHPDSTLYNLENYTEVDIQNHYYQNLGNNGTAMFPVFYPTPVEIGKTNGYYGYDLFITSPERFKYYDTKSPYMNIKVVFGGEGRAVADYSYSQNVNERWNVGFDVFRITSDKQIGSSTIGDRNVVSTSFDFYTYFQHETLPYSAMAHVISMNHNVEETGGIFINDLATADATDLFAYKDANINLRDAQASDKRFNWHLYHQYAWQPQLEFYHSFDYKQQTVGYKDFFDGGAGPGSYRGFYKNFYLGNDSTYSRTDWTEMVNEVGIKGDLANLFYRIYLKRRDIDIDGLYGDPSDKFSETFLGGYTRFDWRDQFNIEASGLISQSGEYNLTGSLNSDLLFGSYKSIRSKPAFIYEYQYTNHHFYDKEFQSSFTNEITAGLQLKLDWLRIRPKGRLQSMDKFMYFDQDINPRQSDEIAVISSIGGDFDFKIYTNREDQKALHFENELMITAVSGNGADNIRIPTGFFNGRYFWRGAWFKNTMKIEIGLDIHGKTSYYANAYAPEIQQFYLQDEFRIDAFVTADAFLNMRINNLRAFVKFTNVNQPEDGGYFVTPYYTGQFRVFDFGAQWLFFD